MGTRIQVVLDAHERELFRRRAAAEGLSLSAWLRDAGRRRLAQDEVSGPRTAEELESFFASLSDPGEVREPDWEQHLRVIDESRRSSASDA